MNHKDVFGFFNYQELYSEMVSKFPDGSKFVELGVYFGKSLCYLCEEVKRQNKSIKVYGIDHWENMYLPFVKNHRKVPDYIIEKVKLWGDVYRMACENLKEHSDIVELRVEDSSYAAKQFGRGEIDFVFVDAGHTYTAVKHDINAWLPKIKPGGVLAGHDFSNDFPEVKTAVSHTLKGKPFNIKNNVWRYDVP